MNLRVLILSLMSAASLTVFSVEPDLLVTQGGECLKVYNLDVTSSDNIYYTLSEGDNAPLQKILKKDVLIVKKSDGTKIDPNVSTQPSSVATGSKPVKTNPGKHVPVTHNATLGKGDALNVFDNDGQELTMRIISQPDRTLAVTKPRKGLRYNRSRYVIPEYVVFNGDTYAVTTIDKDAFMVNTFALDAGIKDIVLPMTLKEIGDNAFDGRGGIYRIIIPDGVERIGSCAFRHCGRISGVFEQLFIPESVRYIGADAFRHVGPNTSYRGYFQGNLSSIPAYVTTGTCTNIGIDEEAVEAYESRNK